MLPRATVTLAALLLLAGQAPSQQEKPPPDVEEQGHAGTPPPGIAAYEKVAFHSSGAGGAEIAGFFRRPGGDAPVPAVVALHGCGGAINARGEMAAREADWANRWVSAGYAVLVVDSFNPRGYRQVCTIPQRQRRIQPHDRAHDIAAAVAWLAGRHDIDRRRLAVVGWSHGAMATLWAFGAGTRAVAADVQAAIAFYPGCHLMLRQPDWRPRVPITMLLGAKDDWTAPGPCRELARRSGARAIEYPGAYHGFDAPASPLRVRSGLGSTASGSAHVGTDPAARAAAIEEVRRLLAEAFR